NRCVNIIAHLFNAPVGEEEETAIGVGTVAFKRKWQNKRKAEGKPFDKPNIFTGANVQVCWEKFAKYFEVELKEVKLSEGYYVMDLVKAVEMVDENTICVAAILGSTLTGEFEDTGYDTPIHVDAASGGFIAPFLYPELEWDFRLPLVKSINVSGHEYSLIYAGVRWVVWRNKEDLPDELIFHINYLGADQPTFTLNFSKGSSQIIAQYYQFIRLGFEMGCFEVLSKEVGVPLVHLHGYWVGLPLSYTMPADAQHVAVLRVVIREDFVRSLVERLLRDFEKVMKETEELPSRIANKVAHVTATVDEVEGGEGAVHKKSVKETPDGVAKYWRKLVDAVKKTSGIC
ncbi:hypothetical protein MKX01_036951, partial [Papaver californicum]